MVKPGPDFGPDRPREGRGWGTVHIRREWRELCSTFFVIFQWEALNQRPGRMTRNAPAGAP
jgi:hypothetical protein